MESTHQPGVYVVKRLGAAPTLVCLGCGFDWPCPGRRLLDVPGGRGSILFPSIGLRRALNNLSRVFMR